MSMRNHVQEAAVCRDGCDDQLVFEPLDLGFESLDLFSEMGDVLLD